MRKKIWFLLPSTLFFLGAPLVWFFCFREVPLTVSPQTTYFTEPLTQDGTMVDFYRAIKDRFEPKVDPRQNGFRDIVAALGKPGMMIGSEDHWLELCRELDLDPESQPTLTYENPYEFLKREYLLWLEENDLIDTSYMSSTGDTDSSRLGKRMLERPWTAEEIPFMARWIEENSPVLDLLAQSVRKEACFCPRLCDPDSFGLLSPSEKYRFYHSGIHVHLNFETALIFRIQYRSGQNRPDAAMEDFLSLVRLRSALRRSFVVVPPLPNRLVEEMKKLLETVPEEKSDRFLADFKASSTSVDPAEVELYARVYSLWTVAEISRSYDQNERMRNRFRFINWNLVAVTINRAYDLRGLNFPPPERSWLEKWLEKPLTVEQRSKELAAILFDPMEIGIVLDSWSTSDWSLFFPEEASESRAVPSEGNKP